MQQRPTEARDQSNFILSYRSSDKELKPESNAFIESQPIQQSYQTNQSMKGGAIFEYPSNQL